MQPLANALELIIRFVFDVALLLFLLRLFAELWHADFSNPVSQAVYRYSNPVLAPIRRLLPNVRRWNLAALIVAFVLEMLKYLLLFAISYHTVPAIGGWLLLAIGALIDFTLMLYVVLLFVWALASMFTAGHRSTHPVLRFITQLVEPAIRPLSRHMPTLGGIDFSPTVAIIALLLARILIANPLLGTGLRLALLGGGAGLT